MPTIFELAAFRIMILTRDHEPPHVHCKGPGIEVLIEIESQLVIRNRDVHAKDVRTLQGFIKTNADVLMNEWRHYHEKS